MDKYPQYSPHFRKLKLYHRIPKSILYFHKSIPNPLKYFANIPIYLKTLPGPLSRPFLDTLDYNQFKLNQ